MLMRLGDALGRVRRDGLPSASAQAYLFALACLGLAAVAHAMFASFVGEITPSILYNPAIFVAALFGGMRAGLVALAVSIGLLWGVFDPSYFGARISPATPMLNWALYVSAALLILCIAGCYRSFAIGTRSGEIAAPDARASTLAGAPAAAMKFWVGVVQRLCRGVTPNPLAGYAVALICIIAVTLLRLGFGRVGGEALPLVSYYPAVLFSALIGGTGAGLFAMVLSLIAVWSEFPGPFLTFRPPTRDESVELSLYVFATLLTVWLAESHRRVLGSADDWQSHALELITSVLVAFTAVLLTTCVLLAIDSFLAPDHLVLGYLLPTIVIAMHYGSTLAVVTSFISGFAAAYFLFPPKFSFYIADPLNVAELGWFLLLAVVASKAIAVREGLPTSSSLR